jgi:hypothetical protein
MRVPFSHRLPLDADQHPGARSRQGYWTTDELAALPLAQLRARFATELVKLFETRSRSASSNSAKSPRSIASTPQGGNDTGCSGCLTNEIQSATISSYTIAAVIVRGDGSVTAIQPLPPIKDLRPNQSRRQETRIRVAALSVTDRVVFVPYEIAGDAVTWSASEEDLRVVVKQAADRFPVP